MNVEPIVPRVFGVVRNGPLPRYRMVDELLRVDPPKHRRFRKALLVVLPFGAKRSFCRQELAWMNGEIELGDVRVIVFLVDAWPCPALHEFLNVDPDGSVIETEVWINTPSVDEQKRLCVDRAATRLKLAERLEQVFPGWSA